MKRLMYHIIRLALGFIPVVLTVAPAAAQIVVNQCDTMEFSVTSRPSIDDTRFVWGIYEASDSPTDVLDRTGVLDPALYFVDGMYASGVGRTVRVTGLQPGEYYVRIHVWDEEKCTDNVEMYLMEVIESLPEAVLYGDSVCIGEPALLRIIFTGTGPYDITYTFGDGSNIVNLFGIVEEERTIPIMVPLPVGETKFWVMTVTDQCTVNSYEADPTKVGVFIFPKPTNSKIYVDE